VENLKNTILIPPPPWEIFFALLTNKNKSFPQIGTPIRPLNESFGRRSLVLKPFLGKGFPLPGLN